MSASCRFVRGITKIGLHKQFMEAKYGPESQVKAPAPQCEHDWRPEFGHLVCVKCAECKPEKTESKPCHCEAMRINTPLGIDCPDCGRRL